VQAQHILTPFGVSMSPLGSGNVQEYVAKRRRNHQKPINIRIVIICIPLVLKSLRATDYLPTYTTIYLRHLQRLPKCWQIINISTPQDMWMYQAIFPEFPHGSLGIVLLLEGTKVQLRFGPEPLGLGQRIRPYGLPRVAGVRRLQ